VGIKLSNRFELICFFDSEAHTLSFKA
jgi:hypothetical protein